MSTYTFTVYPGSWRENSDQSAPLSARVMAVAPISDAEMVFATGVYTITMTSGGVSFDLWSRAGFAASDTPESLDPLVRYLDVPRGGTGTAKWDGTATDVFYIFAQSRPYDVVTITLQTTTPRPPTTPPTGGGTATPTVRDDSSVVFVNPVGKSTVAGASVVTAVSTQGTWAITPPKDIRNGKFSLEEKSARPIEGALTPTVTATFDPGIKSIQGSVGDVLAEIIWYNGDTELGKVAGTPLPCLNGGWVNSPSYDLISSYISGHQSETTSGLSPNLPSTTPGMQKVSFGNSLFGSPDFDIAGHTFTAISAKDASSNAAGRVMSVSLRDASGVKMTSTTFGTAIRNTQWRYRIAISSGKPWNSGTTENVVVLAQPWQADYLRAWESPEFTVPANAWVKVMIDVQCLSSVRARYVSIDVSSPVSVTLRTRAAGAASALGTTSQLIVTGKSPSTATAYAVKLTYTLGASDPKTSYDFITVTFPRPRVSVRWNAPDPFFHVDVDQNYIGVVAVVGERFINGDVIVAVDRMRTKNDSSPIPIFRGEYVVKGSKFYFLDTTVPFNEEFLYQATVRSSDGSHKKMYFTAAVRYPNSLTYPRESMCVPLFISDPLVPGLGLWTGLLSIDPLTHPGRRELVDVIGRHLPVSLSDVRGTPRTVMHLMTRTLAERQHLIQTLLSGRVLYIRNPNPQYPENNWFISVGEVTENRIIPDHARPERKFDVEIALVSKPVGLLSAAYGRSYRTLRDFEPDGSTTLSPKTYTRVRELYPTSYLAIILAEPGSFVDVNNRPEHVYGAGMYPTRQAASTSWSLVQ